MKKSTLAAVLGNIVSLFALWLVNFGIELSAEEQASIVSALLLIVNTCALVIPAVLAGMKRSAPKDGGFANPLLLLALGLAAVLAVSVSGCNQQPVQPPNAIAAASLAVERAAEQVGLSQQLGRITVEREGELLDRLQLLNDSLRRANRLYRLCDAETAPCDSPAALLARVNAELLAILAELQPPAPAQPEALQ